MRFFVQKDVKLQNLGKSVEFKEGDIIRTGISYKYSPEQLEDMLKEFFGSVVIHVDAEKTYALAICKI